jgi:hypothetical protein
LLGARKLGDLAKRMCEAAKRGTLARHFSQKRTRAKDAAAGGGVEGGGDVHVVSEEGGMARVVGERDEEGEGEGETDQHAQQKEEKTSTRANASDTLLEVIEPTLVQLFTREIYIMQRLIEAACITVHQKKNEVRWLDSEEEQEEGQTARRDMAA